MTCILAAPATVLTTVFVVKPFADLVTFSLFKWNGYGAPGAFTGWANYSEILNDPIFWIAVRNNTLLVAVSCLVQLPLGLMLAVLLARETRYAVAFRLIAFMPYVIADVAIGVMFRFILDGDYGPVSAAARVVTTHPIFALDSPNSAVSVVLAVVVWKYFGFHMLLFIARLVSIDRTLYEAASIDGANVLQAFLHITVPQLKPVLITSLLLSSVGALQVFDIVMPLTNGGPFHSTETVVTYMYHLGIERMRVGYGAAVAILLFVPCALLLTLYRFRAPPDA